jgi:hypothetical protein
MNDNARERLRADGLRDYQAPNPGLTSRALSLRAPERHDRHDPHRALQFVAVAVTVALVATIWVVGRHFVLPGVPGSGGPLPASAGNMNVYQADFISPDTGWVLAGAKKDNSSIGLYKTTDGGQHWTRQRLFPTGTLSMGSTEIQFWPDGHGRVTWGPIAARVTATPTPTSTTGGAATKPPRPAGTSALRMFTTTDGGAHWSESNAPLTGGLALVGGLADPMLTSQEGWKLAFDPGNGSTRASPCPRIRLTPW